jgi:PAS domain S-box-containing protein
VPQLPHHDLLASLVDTELIYHNAPSGYLSILPDGTIIRLNRTLLNWLGYKEEEILYHKKFSDLLSKGGRIHYEMFFRPMITVNGNIKELNYEIIRKNGSSFPALLNGIAIYDKDGNLQAITLVVTDITQRNLYEKELLKAKELANSEKERFEFLAETSPEMIWTINPEGQLTYANQRVLQYFNEPAKDLKIKTIFSRIDKVDKITVLRKWLKSDEREKGFKVVLRLQKDGFICEWFEVNVIISQKHTRDIKWFGTCVNVDEHVNAIKRKDDFINMASHELKTPVTVLQSYLQLMELYEIPDAVKDYINKSLRTLKNFQFLISSLLNVSVINSREFTLNLSLFSLNNLLQFTIEQLKHTTSTHELILEMEKGQLMVKADMERISQVIINLVSNAIKYSPGASSVLIKLIYNNQTSAAEIRIRDFGVGISSEDIEKIFDRYYRVALQKSKPGLGLGLYISQSILRSHGSRLTVESEAGKGSTFYFSLPARKEI